MSDAKYIILDFDWKIYRKVENKNWVNLINFKNFDIKVICIEIVNYDFYSKNIKVNKSKIFKIMRKNNYKLEFKSFVNYIFIKKWG